MKSVMNFVWLALVALLPLQAMCAVAEDFTTDAPDTAGDVSAYTINPDDGSEVELAMPDYEKCLKRKRGVYGVGVTATELRSSFWVSIVDPTEQSIDAETGEAFNRTYTWIQARNKCRAKCMELVSLDSHDEYHNLKNLLEYLRIDIPVWTSGKRCLADECADIEQPIHLNGWYWSTTNEMIHPADHVEEGWHHSPWSNFGIMGKPQPDNAENLVDQSVIEACLDIEADPETLKMGWHDAACDRKFGVICEPAPELVEYVEKSLNVSLQNGF